MNRPTAVVCSISKITWETHDTKTFRFDFPPSQRFDFYAGQYTTLTVNLFNPKRNRVMPEIRSFSISSPPTERDYIEITVKPSEKPLVTKLLIERAKVGEVYTLRGPHGFFYFTDDMADNVVLVGGGVGVAPLRSIYRYILERKLEKTVTLLYSVRTPQDIAFQKELDTLAAERDNFKVVITITRPEGWAWQGATGRINRDFILRYLKDPAKSLFYICGPPPMVSDITVVLSHLNVQPSAIKTEKW